MKKHQVQSKAQIELAFTAEFGKKLRAQGEHYIILNPEWYTKGPWYGRQRYVYIEDGADCDFRNAIVGAEWRKKHYRKIGHGAVRSGGSAKLALPVFQIELSMNPSERPHWAMAVMTTEGIKILQRNEAGVGYTPSYDHVIALHI